MHAGVTRSARLEPDTSRDGGRSVGWLVAVVACDGRRCHLCLPLHRDSGQEEYERLRPMSYSKSHVILIAFAIDTPDSLDNVTVKVRYTPL